MFRYIPGGEKHFQEFQQKHHKNYTYISAVAEHMALTKHNFDTETNVEIMYTTSNERILDAVETLHIKKLLSHELLNRDKGPIVSKLYDLDE